jgi:hypothetical protein
MQSSFRHDGPPEHHVVVLVREVVAVRDDVFLAGVVRVQRLRRRLAVPKKDVVLFHVHVHRVDPAAAAVLTVHTSGFPTLRQGERVQRIELEAVVRPIDLKGNPVTPPRAAA